MGIEIKSSLVEFKKPMQLALLLPQVPDEKWAFARRIVARCTVARPAIHAIREICLLVKPCFPGRLTRLAAVAASAVIAHGAPVRLVDEVPVAITLVAPGTWLVDFGKVAYGNLRLTPPASAISAITLHFGEACAAGRIDRSWRHMVESGTTITWEAWDQKYKPNQDWNHAWGAAPANQLPRWVLGAQPLAPGWTRALIRPNPGRLRFAEGKIPTPRGPIWVSWCHGATFQLHACRILHLRRESVWMITGHASGVAANDGSDVQKLNVSALQDKLRAQKQIVDSSPASRRRSSI